MVLLFVKLNHLIRFYFWFTPLALLIICYAWNQRFVNWENVHEMSLGFQFANFDGPLFAKFVFQLVLNMIFVHFVARVYSSSRRKFITSLPRPLLYFPFYFCYISATLGVPRAILHLLPTTFFIPLFGVEISIICIRAPIFFGNVRRFASEIRQSWQNFGLRFLFTEEWERLQVSTLLKTFWISQFALHLVYLVYQKVRSDESSIPSADLVDEIL